MEERPNKALTIVQTAIVSSLLGGMVMGAYYTFRHGHTMTEFFTVTYLAFINKLIMPVGVATVVFYLIVKKNAQKGNFLSLMTRFSILSAIAFVFIFAWNALEVLFRLEEIVNLDRFLTRLTDEMFAGLVLCTPIALMVMIIYGLLKPKS